MLDKYQLEDLLLALLRKQSCFVRVSDIDVGHILVSGVLDLGRLAEQLWEKLPSQPERRSSLIDPPEGGR